MAPQQVVESQISPECFDWRKYYSISGLTCKAILFFQDMSPIKMSALSSVGCDEISQSGIISNLPTYLLKRILF